MSAPFGPFHPFHPFHPPTPAPALAGTGNGHYRAADKLGDEELALVRRLRREVAEHVTETVREQEARTATPMTDQDRHALIHQHLEQLLGHYAEERIRATPSRPPLHPTVESQVRRAVADSLLGAGGLQPLLNNPDVEEIRVLGADRVFVRWADGTVQRVGPVAESDTELVELIRRLAAQTGHDERRFDRAAPVLDLSLPDGSRLNATTKDITHRVTVSIRRHRYPRVTLPDLIGLGMLNPVLAGLLTAAIRAGLNTMISGRTGAGKTTLLKAIARAIPPSDRILTIEDTYELGLHQDDAAHPEVVAYQTRDANVEGAGAFDMDRIFRAALRAMPDRIIVGEVRGGEVVTMLNAASTGNGGSLSTIHARSSANVFRKIALYAAQSAHRLDQATTNALIAESLDLIVALDWSTDATRVITSVREVLDADGRHVSSNEIFRPGPDRRALPGAPPSTRLLAVLEAHGFDANLLHHVDGWDRP